MRGWRRWIGLLGSEMQEQNWPSWPAQTEVCIFLFFFRASISNSHFLLIFFIKLKKRIRWKYARTKSASRPPKQRSPMHCICLHSKPEIMSKNTYQNWTNGFSQSGKYDIQFCDFTFACVTCPLLSFSFRFLFLSKFSFQFSRPFPMLL